MKVAASTWARYEPPSLSASTTAQTHLEVRVGFRVLLILPIVQEQAALPRFGHAHLVLSAQRLWEVVAICAVAAPVARPATTRIAVVVRRYPDLGRRIFDEAVNGCRCPGRKDQMF